MEEFGGRVGSIGDWKWGISKRLRTGMAGRTEDGGVIFGERILESCFGFRIKERTDLMLWGRACREVYTCEKDDLHL